MESEARYRYLVEHAPDMIAAHRRGRFIYVNPAGAKLMGAANPEQLLGRRLLDFVHPEDHKAVLTHTRRALAGLPAPTQILRLLRLDGRPIDAEVRNIPAVFSGRAAVQMIARDVTEQKRVEFELRQDAYYDSLTGLANRTRFLGKIRETLDAPPRPGGRRGALLFLDLDRFKLINDSLGHGMGDQLLVAVAQRLERAFAAEGIVARVGGDEFGLLLEGIGDADAAARAADRVQGVFRDPFVLDGRELFSSASIGIVLVTPDYRKPEHLLRDADTAMNRAKSLGKARAETFDPNMHASAMVLFQTETDLRRAIDRNEFCLFYQPIVSLQTRRLVGFEALLRWQHPRQGLVPPGDFIAVAEETGLIIPIGWWVLSEAARQLRAWRDRRRDRSGPWMSVNLSSRQFSQPQLIERISHVLAEANLPPEALRLEITESALMENAESVTALLLRLRALNVQLYIDDFGTGYSSLSYLHRFPVNTLKVDRSFVRRLENEQGSPDILKAIVTLAHNLGMDVTAEGVETAEQVATLEALRCKYAQGFFFAKPMDGAAATDLLLRDPVW